MEYFNREGRQVKSYLQQRDESRQRSKSLKSHACLGQVQKCKLKYKAYFLGVWGTGDKDTKRTGRHCKGPCHILASTFWYVREKNLEVLWGEESWSSYAFQKWNWMYNMYNICWKGQTQDTGYLEKHWNQM